MKDKKAVLKNGLICIKPKQKTVSKFKKICSLVSTGLAVLFASAGVHYLNILDPGIVNTKSSGILADIQATNTEYMNNNGVNYRFIAPNNGSIKYNVNIPNLTEEEKAIFTRDVNELNMICNTINERYSFEVNFNPTISDMAKLYCINVEEYDFNSQDSDTSTLGNCQNLFAIPTVAGLGVYKAKINIHSNLLDKNNVDNVDDNLNYRHSALSDVFKHESGHAILGLEDAYELEHYNVPTLMQSVGNQSFGWSENDLKIFINKLSETDNIKVTSSDLLHKLDWWKELNENVQLLKNDSRVKEIFNKQGVTNEEDMIFDEMGNVKSYSMPNSTIMMNQLEHGTQYEYNFFEVSGNQSTRYYFSNDQVDPHYSGARENFTETIENVLLNKYGEILFRVGDKFYSTMLINDQGGKRFGSFVEHKICNEKEYNTALTHCGMLYSSDYQSNMKKLIKEFISNEGIKIYDKLDLKKLYAMYGDGSNFYIKDFEVNGDTMLIEPNKETARELKTVQVDDVLWLGNNSIVYQSSENSIKKISFYFDAVSNKLVKQHLAYLNIPSQYYASDFAK